ncbi:MAG: (d)CMP kinase [Deltaproteobacteria bacterium]|nr:(d)CMP kinase [Deltaproteobacteria bacterium]MBI3390647.1 (d)CMP kinase [Deltaproteobacteria bacterium]
MKPIVIAIDGPAGAGKSTVSRTLAQRLGYRYVDTGAMYRVIGVLAAEQSIELTDASVLATLCDTVTIRFETTGDRVRTFADGRDLSDLIRSAAAGQLASKVSTVPAVRDRLVAQQRTLGAGGGVVMEGRDIGTVVFPSAPLKVFLDASPLERARRRAAELQARGERVDVDAMAREIADRDTRDRTRAHSPLRPADDAHVIDSTGRGIEAIVDELVELARRAQGTQRG